MVTGAGSRSRSQVLGERWERERSGDLWGEEAALPGDSSCVDLLALVSDLAQSQRARHFEARGHLPSASLDLCA
eukprot:1446720-Rhodomonas_salina.1